MLGSPPQDAIVTTRIITFLAGKNQPKPFPRLHPGWGVDPNYMGVNPKIVGFTPQIIHFNRVFHYFHHPFWEFSSIFGNIPYIRKSLEIVTVIFFPPASVGIYLELHLVGG